MSKPAVEGKPTKKGFGASAIIIAMLGAIGAVAMLPSTIILLLGMIPTAVAYTVDSSRERALGRVVMCMNFAGTLPCLLKLWQQGHTVANALDIMTQPIMMALILIPTAFGWMIYSYVPYLVVGIVRRKAEARIRTLTKFQDDLVEQWGPGVAGNVIKQQQPASEQNSVETIPAEISA